MTKAYNLSKFSIFFLDVTKLKHNSWLLEQKSSLKMEFIYILNDSEYTEWS